MIRISKLADYAIVILAALSTSDASLKSASDLAKSTKLSEPTVSKVLKILVKGDVVQSVRGASGGYKLVRSLNELSIDEVIAAIDGPIAITACAGAEEQDCSLIDSCSVRGRWNDVNTALVNALKDVKLADMVNS